MNKEYTYLDGKVIISDENGDKTQSEYYDNLDKVLIQENVIETMEQQIKKLEQESASYNNKNHYIPVVFPVTVFMTTIGAPLFSNYLSNNNIFETSINTIFGPISEAMATSIVMSVLMIPVGAFIEFSLYQTYKSCLKREKGINSELVFLKEQIEEEKEDLEILKQNKSRKNECTEFRTIKVDDLQQLKTLRGYLNLYFDLGYNIEKYYQYYQKGLLDKKLQNYYTDTGIQIAKEYLEEKGPSLVLSKKKQTEKE